jgi:ribulose-phosphate 3-epimerase
MQPFLLSASILSANFRHLEQDILRAVQAGVDWIHVDVMDGHFVPNISMGSFIVEFCREITSIPIDVHLMIEKPEHHIAAFAKAGASYLTIHPEGNPNVLRTLQEIRSLGCKAGVALNPGTPIPRVRPLIDFLDMILVLTVNPGFSGQAFIPQMLYKIEELSTLIRTHNPSIQLEVDGGLNQTNIATVLNAGATVIVSASSIFKNSVGIEKSIQLLKSAVV